MALEERVTELEADGLQASQHARAADNATSRQGSVLLDLRRQVEDLDNCGRWNNIHVRGLPEEAGEELTTILTRLFTQILGDGVPTNYNIEMAYRALRTPRNDGITRDIVCCLSSFRLKEAIMRAAQPQNVTFLEAQVALFQNFYLLTLEARRALRPLTRLLQDKGFQYKWGYPFSLQARKANIWHILRWTNDTPGFLRGPWPTSSCSTQLDPAGPAATPRRGYRTTLQRTTGGIVPRGEEDLTALKNKDFTAPWEPKEPDPRGASHWAQFPTRHSSGL
ncbi:Hypothetical predicted protein [Pelobates cultripes]|uniref:Uncharacterized protein n=1 Tax=Pelobates cultripes TaxID=61616 RepID=A0AAD1VRB0_PELCU|nr:Hypothetical predicted protein [Pelobates cultripes]